MQDFLDNEATDKCSSINVHGTERVWNDSDGDYDGGPNGDMRPSLPYYYEQTKEVLRQSLAYYRIWTQTAIDDADFTHMWLKRTGRCAMLAGFAVAERLADVASGGSYGFAKAGIEGGSGQEYRVSDLREWMNRTLGFAQGVKAWGESDQAPTTADPCMDSIVDAICSVSSEIAKEKKFWGHKSGFNPAKDTRMAEIEEYSKTLLNRVKVQNAVDVFIDPISTLPKICKIIGNLDRIDKAINIPACTTSGTIPGDLLAGWNDGWRTGMRELKSMCDAIKKGIGLGH
jgi:hypothetical protein